jgi:SAM-dependent methyltransferase
MTFSGQEMIENAAPAGSLNQAEVLADPRFEWGRLRWALEGALSACSPADRVLDVGCGKGWLVEAFARAGLAGHGVDMDPQAIEDSKAFCPGADIRSYDGVHLPYPDGHFRAVTLIEVLEHVDDDAGLVREIHRVLAHGGTLVLTTPHAGPWAWLDPDNFKFRAPSVHRAFYRMLGRSQEYEKRFANPDRPVVGNFTRRGDGSTPWHRHYTKEQVEALAPGFETMACRREGGLLFALMLVANYAGEKLLGTWPAPTTALMRWDARKDLGERGGWAMQMVLRRCD